MGVEVVRSGAAAAQHLTHAGAESHGTAQSHVDPAGIERFEGAERGQRFVRSQAEEGGASWAEERSAGESVVRSRMRQGVFPGHLRTVVVTVPRLMSEHESGEPSVALVRRVIEDTDPTPQRPTPTRAQIAELSACHALFLPGDPPRHGQVAFYCADGQPPRLATNAHEDAYPYGELTIVRPHGADVREHALPAVFLPVGEALPVLSRCRGENATESAAFWGAAALLALRAVARGQLLPGLSDGDYDSWRLGPLQANDVQRMRSLAENMPPEAHAAPLAGVSPPRLPEPYQLLRTFLDGLADALPRRPAPHAAAGFNAFVAAAPQHLPGQRAWAEELADGTEAGVRVSLRVELPDGPAPEDDEPEDEPDDVPFGGEGAGQEGGAGQGCEAAGETGDEVGDAEWRTEPLRAVVQLQNHTDATVLTDAAELWAGDAPGEFGPRARVDTLRTLRRAAQVWQPLGRLLTAEVPDALELSDDEASELLGDASQRLADSDVRVHWPKELARSLTAEAVVEPVTAESDMPSMLSAESIVGCRWRLALDDRELSEHEVTRIAEAHRPLVKLRDQWVVVDPALARKARARDAERLDGLSGLRAALTGEAEVDGELVDVQPAGWLAELRDRLTSSDDMSAPKPVTQPVALTADLRDYQLHGLNWLHRMTSLGLGCCLADDMGLGKTITLIALHLHRQTLADRAGPTLVVCPASLLGNWQREIERFAPGTPVRRYHGAGRELTALAVGEFALTTYDTMRRDARVLADTGPWGMVVADEAQHVKNPLSGTAKALRTIGSAARVALTGTPMENNLSELWALLDWTTPGLLGTLPSFRDRYARTVESDLDEEAAARLAELVHPFLLRRRKSDPNIAPELPPKTETSRTVSLTKEQVGLYEAVVRETMAEIAESEGVARRGLVVKLLTGLKQICNHPAQYLKEQQPRLSGRSGKLRLLDELLDTIRSEDSAVLIFTQYVAMGRLLQSHLQARKVPMRLLHGGTPVQRREEMVRSFQSGDVPVLVLSLKAAGTGLNLTRAGHVVHFDRWWNPAVEDQATDRAYRIGQTQPVQVHRLVAEHTVEDRIAEMLEHKRDLADAVLSGGDAALTELSDRELAELVDLRGGQG